MEQPKVKFAELVLIRHGQTAWNEQGRWQGQQDVPLSDLGLRQAQAVAARLRHTHVDAIYSSDLRRASDTAAAIATAVGVPVRLDARLRERSLGLFEGHTLAEVMAKFPREYAEFRAHKSDYRMPGGESTADKHARSVECLEDLCRRHARQRIVVVTHMGVMDSAFRHAMSMGLDVRRHFMLYNASLNVFRVTDGLWVLCQWGDIAHLQAEGLQDE